MLKKLYTITRHFFRTFSVFFCTNRAIAVILTICIWITSFAMQIMLSPISAMTNEVNASPMTNAFYLDFSESFVNEETYTQLKSLFDDESFILDKPVYSGFYCTFSKGSPVILGVKNFGDNMWYVQAEGRSFTPEEITRSAKVTIISKDAYKWNDFAIDSHHFDISDEEYQIIGLGDFHSSDQFFIGHQDIYQNLSEENNLKMLLQEAYSSHAHDDEFLLLQERLDTVSQTVLIPYTTYEQSSFLPTVVCFMFESISPNEYQPLLDAIRKSFPNAVVSSPFTAKQILSASMKREIIISILMSVCCLLFLCALFIFWSKRNLHAIRCCRVVGASKKRMISALYFSWIIMLITGYTLSFALSWLIHPFMMRIRLSMNMDFGYHVLLCIILIVVTSIFVQTCFKSRKWKDMIQ